MKDCLEILKVKLEDCVGSASGGASKMFGEHNCVWSTGCCRVEKVNAYFQAKNTDANLLMKELDNFHISVRNRVYNANGIALGQNVDFCEKFVFEAAKIKQNSENNACVIAGFKEV
eukprot:gene7437-13199_t